MKSELPLSSDLRDEVRRLLETITPGEWIAGRDGNNRVYGPDGCLDDSGLLAIVFKGRGNVDFIAAAPRLLRLLSQQVEALEQENERLKNKTISRA